MRPRMQTSMPNNRLATKIVAVFLLMILGTALFPDRSVAQAQNPSVPPVYAAMPEKPSRQQQRQSRPPRGIRYQGELFTGYTMGLGKETNTWVYDRVPLHLLNGMNFGGAFFFGLGFGLNAWGDWSSKDAIRNANVTVPIYFNFKWYLPARESLFKFFLGADMGGIMQGRAELGGLLLGPMTGFRVRIIGRLGLSFSVSYLYEGWVEGMKNAVSLMYNTHSVSFRAGITF